MSRASHCCSNFNNFAGAAHVIPDDDDATCSTEPPLKMRDPPHSSQMNSPRKMRENSQYTKVRESINIPHTDTKLREDPSITIPYTERDFDPIKSTPLSS